MHKRGVNFLLRLCWRTRIGEGSEVLLALRVPEDCIFCPGTSVLARAFCRLVPDLALTHARPAQIFPRMKNYTPHNRATSVGNQLLNNYRKFLLAYEVCHRGRDLSGAVTRSAATEVRECVPC